MFFLRSKEQGKHTNNIGNVVQETFSILSFSKNRYHNYTKKEHLRSYRMILDEISDFFLSFGNEIQFMKNHILFTVEDKINNSPYPKLYR